MSEEGGSSKKRTGLLILGVAVLVFLMPPYPTNPDAAAGALFASVFIGAVVVLSLKVVYRAVRGGAAWAVGKVRSG